MRVSSDPVVWEVPKWQHHFYRTFWAHVLHTCSRGAPSPGVGGRSPKHAPDSWRVSAAHDSRGKRALPAGYWNTERFWLWIRVAKRLIQCQSMPCKNRCNGMNWNRNVSSVWRKDDGSDMFCCLYSNWSSPRLLISFPEFCETLGACGWADLPWDVFWVVKSRGWRRGKCRTFNINNGEKRNCRSI